MLLLLFVTSKTKDWIQLCNNFTVNKVLSQQMVYNKTV